MRSANRLILRASAREAQENQYCTIQAHDILVVEATNPIAKPGFRDCCYFVDHQSAGDLKAVLFARHYSQTKQRR
ncbi:MAG TPA: hypothetical protein VGA68_05840 [Woeseiaceae bacterium]|jgi:hypothetical protein